MFSISSKIVSEYKEHLQILIDELISELDPQQELGCRVAINDILPNSAMEKIADSERLSRYEDYSSSFRWVQDFSRDSDKIKGIAGLVASLQKPVISGNVKEHPYWMEFDETSNSATAISIICVPIFNQSEKTRCVGVLSVTALVEDYFEDEIRQNHVFRACAKIGELWDTLLSIEDPNNPPLRIWLSLDESGIPDIEEIHTAFNRLTDFEDEQFKEKGGRKPVRTNRLWKLFNGHEHDIFTLDFISDKLFFHSKTRRRTASNSISELNQAFSDLDIDLECVRLTAYMLRKKSK